VPAFAGATAGKEALVIGLSLTRPVVCALALAIVGAQSAPQPDQFFPPLSKQASTVWGQYLTATEERRARELSDPKNFLALDFTPGGGAARQAILAGNMPIGEVATLWQNKTKINVPNNWVHHWRGAVLIPGVRLDQVFARLQEAVPGTGQGDVVKSTIRGKEVGKDGTHLRTYMQVQRSGSVAMIGYHLVYNTEHEVTFTRRTPTTGTSKTVATKIAELDNPQSGVEREFPAGKDGGYLRRWNSYWRYEEVADGVIAECEAITLSRDAPAIANLLGARGIAESAARESLSRALVNLREFFRTPPASLRVR
jgi:hypothetical protein